MLTLLENLYSSAKQTEDLKSDRRERHSVIIELTHQKDIILNICASNSESTYKQQKWTKLKGEIDQSTEWETLTFLSPKLIEKETENPKGCR